MTMHAFYRLKAMMQGTSAAVAARALAPPFLDAAGVASLQSWEDQQRAFLRGFLIR